MFKIKTFSLNLISIIFLISSSNLLLSSDNGSSSSSSSSSRSTSSTSFDAKDKGPESNNNQGFHPEPMSQEDISRFYTDTPTPPQENLEASTSNTRSSEKESKKAQTFMDNFSTNKLEGNKATKDTQESKKAQTFMDNFPTTTNNKAASDQTEDEGWFNLGINKATRGTIEGGLKIGINKETLDEIKPGLAPAAELIHRILHRIPIPAENQQNDPNRKDSLDKLTENLDKIYKGLFNVEFTREHPDSPLIAHNHRKDRLSIVDRVLTIAERMYPEAADLPDNQQEKINIPEVIKSVEKIIDRAEDLQHKSYHNFGIVAASVVFGTLGSMIFYKHHSEIKKFKSKSTLWTATGFTMMCTSIGLLYCGLKGSTQPAA